MKINSCVVKAVGMFILGAGVGSVATNYVVKTKYENIAIEQIDAYQERILNQVGDGEIMNEEDIPFNAVITEEEMPEKDYRMDTITTDEPILGGYTDKMNHLKEIKKPYRINVEEFDTIDGYTCKDIDCYNDEIIDEDGTRVDGIEYIVDFLEREDGLIDEVYVRDETNRTDYHLIRYDEDYYEF